MQIHFAPLQGYTTATYRRHHHSIWAGIDSYYTPFVRIEKDNFRRRDIIDIAPENNTDTPVIPQMLPRDCDELQRITEYFLSLGYTRADINMGCPFPPIALHKRGAGLLAHPQAVAQILQCTEKYPEMKFSVKMRLGWEQVDECMHLIDILNAAPLTHITMHPRIGRQQYKGSIHHEEFAQFLSRCNHPIIYNGDICTIKDVENIQQQYPTIAGIMIGRGLLARPYLTQLINQDAYNSIHTLQLTQQFHDIIYNELQQTSQGNTQLMQRAHALWEYFLPHAPRKQRKHIIKASTPQSYQQAVEQLFNTWEKEIDSYPL